MTTEQQQVVNEIKAAIATLSSQDQQQVFHFAQLFRDLTRTETGRLALALVGAEFAAE